MRGHCNSLSRLGNLLYYLLNFHYFSQKYFGNFNFGHFFCPFLKNPKKSWKKIIVETINYFYRLVAKKIIFNLLA